MGKPARFGMFDLPKGAQKVNVLLILLILSRRKGEVPSRRAVHSFFRNAILLSISRPTLERVSCAWYESRGTGRCISSRITRVDGPPPPFRGPSTMRSKKQLFEAPFARPKTTQLPKNAGKCDILLDLSVNISDILRTFRWKRKKRQGRYK